MTPDATGRPQDTDSVGETPAVASPETAGEGSVATHTAGRTTGSKPRRQRKQRSFWVELPFLIVVAFILALLLRAFIVQAFYIPSESMENTLLPNDKVVVSKLSYRIGDIHRGDIVVFDVIGLWMTQQEYDNEQAATAPTNPVAKIGRKVGGLVGFTPLDQDYYIKRVIGVGGDKVACCDAKGRVTVNGHALDEASYLYPGAQPSATDFSVTVPAGRLWVMGDNRGDSSDSRAHMGYPGGGTVPDSAVVGRAVALVYPVSRWTRFTTPATFEQSALTASGAVALPLGPGGVGDRSGPGSAGAETDLTTAAAAACVVSAWPAGRRRTRR